MVHFRHPNLITEDDATQYLRHSHHPQFAHFRYSTQSVLNVKKCTCFTLFLHVIAHHLDPYRICRVPILKTK